MPTWVKPFSPDGGTYVLEADRDLPPDQCVVFHHRDPTATERAQLEDGTGYLSTDLTDTGTPDGRWCSTGAANAIRSALLLTTDVKGPGPDGAPLEYPAPGRKVADPESGESRPSTRADRERFFAQIHPADVTEYGRHLIRRGELTEDERGN